MSLQHSSSNPQDDEICALIARGEIERATEQALRAYGPELIGWLRSILMSDDDACEAFSLLSEKLWKSLRSFGGRCSVRTWCYMLARQSTAAIRAQPYRSHEEMCSSVPSIAHAVMHVWNTSRENAKVIADVYTQIRHELDEDDQTLLILRVDRDLAWRDIAIVLLGESANSDELKRKAAALRKQFERVKEQLRELAAKVLYKT